MMIGPNGVGKHTLINSSFGSHKAEARTSTNSCLDLIIHRKDQSKVSVKYQFWVRTLSDNRYDTLVKVYYQNVSAFIFVYSITDHKSFEKVAEAIELIVEEVPKQKFIGMLIANKSDLNTEREVSYEEGLELKKKFGLSYFVETNHFIEEKTPQIIRKIDDLLSVYEIVRSDESV